MVIGLVLLAVSVGLLIIVAVIAFAIRNYEMPMNRSKCYVIESVYMQVFKCKFSTGFIFILFWILSLIIVLIDAVLWIATAAVVARQEGIC